MGEKQGKMTKVLLQIFSANLIGPIFFEFIQRKGDEGFGEGNFRRSSSRSRKIRSAVESQPCTSSPPRDCGERNVAPLRSDLPSVIPKLASAVPGATLTSHRPEMVCLYARRARSLGSAFQRSQAVLHNRACDEFLAMMQKLELSQSGIPDMEKLSGG